MHRTGQLIFYPILTLLLILSAAPSAAADLDINGYRSILILGSSHDPYGVAIGLRSEAQARGFRVYVNPQDVPQDEIPVTCLLSGQWRVDAVGGSVGIEIHDIVTGQLVFSASKHVIAWTTAAKAVRKVSRKLFDAINYTGFSPEASKKNLSIQKPRLYPDSGSEESSTQHEVNAPKKLSATGTGFLVAPSILATNYHVIENGAEFKIYFPEVAGIFPGRIIVVDKANDLALLEILPKNGEAVPLTQALPLADSPLSLGQDLYTIGFPLSAILGNRLTVTEGAVSAVQGIDEDPRFFQVSIPTQPGNSGGPVINEAGEVVGILTAGLNKIEVLRESGSLPENINFAIKIDYLKLLIPPSRRATKEETVTTNGSSKRSEQVAILKGSVGQVRVYK